MAPPSAQAAYERILPYAEAIYLVIAADGVHTPEERDAMLRPDEAPKKPRRSRSRSWKSCGPSSMKPVPAPRKH